MVSLVLYLIEEGIPGCRTSRCGTLDRSESIKLGFEEGGLINFNFSSGCKKKSNVRRDKCYE